MYNSREIEQVAAGIQRGGCAIYPTETLYALGGNALDPAFCSRVCMLKNRSQGKPLPVVIGKIEQLSALTNWNSEEFYQLCEKFWPGPLSILVPAKKYLPLEIRDTNRMICVRWTSSPIAARLCVLTQTPLIASSANWEGDIAPVLPSDLNPKLKQQVDYLLTDASECGRNLPSTIVKILGDNRLEVIRSGAMSLQLLEQAGYILKY